MIPPKDVVAPVVPETARVPLTCPVDDAPFNVLATIKLEPAHVVVTFIFADPST